MRSVIFTPAASAELIEAQDWYEKEVAGLGRQFLDSVTAATERIIANPLLFPVIYKNARRALLRRFPYSIIFVIELNGAVTVIACFHASRNPARWRNRL